MMTLFRAALGGAFLTCIGALSVSAEMNDTEKQLFRLLKSKPDFIREMPAGRELVDLVFKGRTVAGPLEWGVSPTDMGIRPIGIRTHVARNCNADTVLTISDTLKAEYEDKQTWELTAGVEISNSVEVTASLPLAAEVATTSEVKISFEGAKGGEKSFIQSHSAGYSVPVKPGREMDVQLQVVEQVIEGTPFSIEMELLGSVEITHPPRGNWVRVRGNIPANTVIAGEEKTADGTKWRDLRVCRAAGTAHIGKTIGNRCNYGYGGKELSTANVDVLTISGLEIDWVSKAQFEKDHDERSVAEGRAPVYYAGQENRPTGRYAGRTFVCRAKHKGNFHPGKVVISDCMIGYGGDELQKGNYEVLLRGKEVGNITAVNLGQYLDRAERSFVVEGIFKDARASSATTVLGPTRPLNRETCPGYVAPQKNVSVRDAEVEFSAPVIRSGDTIAFFSASRSDLEEGPSSTVEPAITGTTLAEITFGREVETRARLVSRLLRDLRVDMFGADVTAAQQALNDAGGGLEVDGYFGPKTARALRNFQRVKGLVVDGVFGPASQKALGL
jgi:hypothetical protein